MKILLVILIVFSAHLVLPSSIISKRGIPEDDQKKAVEGFNNLRKKNATDSKIANMMELVYDSEFEKMAEEISNCVLPKSIFAWRFFSSFDNLRAINSPVYNKIGCTKAPKNCVLEGQDLTSGQYFCVVGAKESELRNVTVKTGAPGSECPEGLVSKDGLCGVNSGHLAHFNLLLFCLSVYVSI